MKRIALSVSVAANTTVRDVFTNQNIDLMERVAQRDGVVRLFATRTATGLTVTPKLGTDITGTDLEPEIKATAPLYSENLIFEGVILAGQAVALRAVNTTGGAITLFILVEIDA